MRKELKSPQPYGLKHFKYSSHYWILKFLSEERRPLKILDVGAADGYLGAILKEQGHYVVGIERDAALAATARNHYACFEVVDIESFDFPYSQEFDCVLFADVLEHLRDPATVLKRELPCLKTAAQVIASVPNVANIVIRASLFLGRFEYGDRGILDRTHLRFFSLKSLKTLLNRCGFDVRKIYATPIPVQMILPVTNRQFFAPLHGLHHLVVRLWKTLFAYQFVVKADVRTAH